MSDTVVVAIISVFGTIVTAAAGVLVVLMEKTRRHAKATRHQTENDHKTNLRVELDERHAQLMAALGLLDRRLVGAGEKLDAHELRLDEIERSDLRRASIYESGIPATGG